MKRAASTTLLCASLVGFALSSPAAAQATDEPTPQLTTPDDPASAIPIGDLPLPEDFDPSPAQQLLEGLLPVHTDIFRLIEEPVSSVLSGDGCGLEAFTPQGEPWSTFRVTGTATVTCPQPVTAIRLQVCVDEQRVGQWYPLGCHERLATGTDALSASVTVVCHPGNTSLRTKGFALIGDQGGSRPAYSLLAYAELGPKRCWE